MATPFFSTDSELKAALRLTKMGTDSDAVAQYENAVLESRTEFWRRLGGARLDYLKSLSPAVGSETTDSEFLRSVAKTTEVRQVRCQLMSVFQMRFKDGGSQPFKEWNDEAAFRNLNPFSVAKMKESLTQQLDIGFAILSGDIESGDSGLIQGFVAQSDERDARGGPKFLGSGVLGENGIFN